jgi:hypothetical protein
MIKLSNRAALTIIVLLALCAWGGLLFYTRFIPPRAWPSYLAFFAILSVALTCTFAFLAYLISRFFFSSRLYKATVLNSLRQGALLALVIIFNLILRALNSWNIVTAIVIFVAAIIVEVVSLGRK